MGAFAAKVRRAKEARPEHFCKYAPCLWRTVNGQTGEVTPCPRHQASNANELQGLLEQSVAATAKVGS